MAAKKSTGKTVVTSRTRNAICLEIATKKLTGKAGIGIYYGIEKLELRTSEVKEKPQMLRNWG